MIALQDYNLQITTADRRFKSGVRVVGTYVYHRKHDLWMEEEVRDLQAGLYPAPKYKITVLKIEPVQSTC